jgi:hypothetical protein
LKRPALAGGLLLLVLILWLPSRVLFICVAGNTLVPEKQILEAAEKCGVGFGASRKDVRSESVKNALLEALPQLQWVGVNTSGCHAVITVREKSLPEKEEESDFPASMVASRDGYILSCTAERGSLAVTPGQTVQQGGFGERVSLTADPENNLIMVYNQNEKTYYLYDRTDLLENPSVEPLKKIKCEGHQTPAMGLDDSQGRYTASIRGYALADGYIYQLSGSTSIYISVFDLDGKLQYCYRLPDHPELEGRSPGAIAVENGKVYVTIQSGNSTCYYANLWVYEAAAE